MTPFTIYLIGVLVLGLSYSFLKNAMPSAVFLVAVLGYLIALRWIATRYGRK